MNPTLLIITGAASGIGLELASYFAKLSTNLILIDTDEKTLKESFQENEQISLIAADITQEDTWNKAIDLAKGRFTPISHLINCAGVIQPGFLLNYKISDIAYHLDINTKGSILGTTLIAREMKNQEFGHIINISSLAGIAPVAGLSLYTASKFAMFGFSLAVAAELEEYGVEVSVVCPDLVRTPMLETQLNYPKESVLSFSGPEKVLTPVDVRQAIVQLIKKPKRMICIPERRGLLAKIAGTWPGLGEFFRAGLERKGEKALSRLK